MLALLTGLVAVVPALIGLFLQARDADALMLRKVEREAEVLDKVTDPVAQKVLAEAHQRTTVRYLQRVRGDDRVPMHLRRIIWTAFLATPVLVVTSFFASSEEEYFDRDLAQLLFVVVLGVVGSAFAMQVVPAVVLSWWELRDARRERNAIRASLAADKEKAKDDEVEPPK